MYYKFIGFWVLLLGLLFSACKGTQIGTATTTIEKNITPIDPKVQALYDTFPQYRKIQLLPYDSTASLHLAVCDPLPRLQGDFKLLQLAENNSIDWLIEGNKQADFDNYMLEKATWLHLDGISLPLVLVQLNDYNRGAMQLYVLKDKQLQKVLHVQVTGQISHRARYEADGLTMRYEDVNKDGFTDIVFKGYIVYDNSAKKTQVSSLWLWHNQEQKFTEQQ